MTRYFVSGGAGFVGSHLVDKLVEDKSDQVIIYDNMFRGKMENISQHVTNKQVDFIKGDIRDYDYLLHKTAGSDIVFHLAAQSNVIGSMNNPDYCFETNVIGTYNILKACKENKVNKVIFSSSREVYGDAQYIPVDENHPLNAKNVYGASKIAGEVYCRVFENLYGMDVSVLRLSNVYGKRDYGRVIPIWIDQLRNNQDLKIYGGRQIIDFIYVDYVVEALIEASKTNLNSQPVNIGSGKGITLPELANYMRLFSFNNVDAVVYPARDFETTNFVANVARMYSHLGMLPPSSSLCNLPEMML